MSVERRSIRGGVRLLLVLAVLTLCCAAGSSARAEAQGGLQNDAALTVVEIKPNFFMIAGAGSNVAVHIGAGGVIVIDTGNAAVHVNDGFRADYIRNSANEFAINMWLRQPHRR